MDKRPVLWIIIPCYNEQEVLPVTAPMFLDKLQYLVTSGRVDKESRILFVNDGSKDRTWEIISELAEKDSRFLGISQSRNRGHQNALDCVRRQVRQGYGYVVQENDSAGILQGTRKSGRRSGV